MRLMLAYFSKTPIADSIYLSLTQKIRLLFWVRFLMRVARLLVIFNITHQSQGVGRLLVERFEEKIIKRDGKVIRVASSLYAVPFFERLGYKKSTGVRNSWSFDGYGLSIQPMRKVIK